VTASGTVLRIATRASDLARWQADHVAGLLQGAHEGLRVEIVPVSTEGDERTDVPLSEIGGKGVFVKEVQRAVLSGDADLAVHSAKDLPAITPNGLTLAAVPERGEVRDALVGADIENLVAASAGDHRPVVATGSARRRVQLAESVPGVVFEELRGNMATRLGRAEGFDAIVVAAVALERLGLSGRVSEVISVDKMVPQVGQGALAVECRSEDLATLERLTAVEDRRSRITVDAERAFLAELGGDCTLPAGAYCTVRADGLLRMVGVLSCSAPATGVDPGSRDPVQVAREDAIGDDPGDLGRSVATSLLEILEGS
jgi:hydroxymethylbilane synthase